MWNWREDKVILTMIRHGMTHGNEVGRYIGCGSDEHLSDKGIMCITKKQYPKADIIISSPMIRCVETANIIYAGRDIHVINELKEIDFGEFEGKNYEELKYDERYIRWIDGRGIYPPPKGEKKEDFVNRSVNGYDKMINYIKKTGENIDSDILRISLCVHGGTIMAITSHLTGCDYYDYQIKNGEYITISGNIGNDEWRIL